MNMLLPSEVGRLVLGYLREEGCIKTFNEFMKECIHVAEYATFYRKGVEYPTRIGGKSLKQMLNEYGKHVLYKTDVCEVSTVPKTQLQISGAMASRGQASRMRSNNLSVTRFLAQRDTSSRTEASDDDQINKQGLSPTPPSPPPPESDPAYELHTDDLVVETDKVCESPVKTSPQKQCPKSGPAQSPSSNVYKATPIALGSCVPVNVFPKQMINNETSTDSGSQPSKDSKDSDSTNTKARTTRKKRNSEKKRANNNEPVKKKIPVDSSSPVRTRSKKLKVSIASPSLNDYHEPVSPNISTSPVLPSQPNPYDETSASASPPQTNHTEADMNMETSETSTSATPRKESNSSDINPSHLRKSPRRKRPVPHRRSMEGSYPPVAAVPTDKDVLSMPLWDDLITNTKFAETIADSINRAKKVTETEVSKEVSDAGAGSSISVSQSEKGSEPSTESNTDNNTSILLPDAVEENSINNVLHLQDSAMTEEAIKEIVELTKKDPTFDALFHMLQIDKNEYVYQELDRIEEANSEKDTPEIHLTDAVESEPVSSTSSTGSAQPVVLKVSSLDENVLPTKDTTTAKVLFPSKYGPPLIEHVKIHLPPPKIINIGANQDSLFKVPEVPPADTTKSSGVKSRTGEDIPEPAAPKKASRRGGSRKKKSLYLGVPGSIPTDTRESCSSSDSNPSTTSQPHLPDNTPQVPPDTTITHRQSTSPLPTYTPPPPLLYTSHSSIQCHSSSIPLTVTADSVCTLPNDIINAFAIYTRGDAMTTQSKPTYRQADSQFRMNTGYQMYEPNIQPVPAQHIQDYTVNTVSTMNMQNYSASVIGNVSTVTNGNLNSVSHNGLQCQAESAPSLIHSAPQALPVQTIREQHQITAPVQTNREQHQITAPVQTNREQHQITAPSVQTDREQHQIPTNSEPTSREQHQITAPCDQNNRQQRQITAPSALPEAANSQAPQTLANISATNSTVRTDIVTEQQPETVNGREDLKAPQLESVSLEADLNTSVPKLTSSPFYSNPETPTLGAQEEVASNSPYAVSPYSTITSSMSSSTSAGVVTPHRRRHHGAARTHCPYPKYKQYTKRSRVNLASSYQAKDGHKSENQKDDTTPVKEQEGEKGGGTPLATREAQVIDILVNLSRSPTKDRATKDLFKHLPAANPQVLSSTVSSIAETNPDAARSDGVSPCQERATLGSGDVTMKTVETPTKPAPASVSTAPSSMLTKLVELVTRDLNARTSQTETKDLEKGGEKKGVKRKKGGPKKK